MQLGVAGDQPRAGRSGAPGPQRLHAAVDHLGMLRQAEIVVGGEVDLGADRRPRSAATGAARPPGAAARRSSSQASGERSVPRHGGASIRDSIRCLPQVVRATADHGRGDLVDLRRRADVRRHRVDEVAERPQPHAVVAARPGWPPRRSTGSAHLDDADRAEHPDVGHAGSARAGSSPALRPASISRTRPASPVRAAVPPRPPPPRRPARWP